jgi:hypothetical protein
MTNPRLLPAATAGDVDPWEQALYAFLVEKGNRSGSRRTTGGRRAQGARGSRMVRGGVPSAARPPSTSAARPPWTPAVD